MEFCVHITEQRNVHERILLILRAGQSYFVQNDYINCDQSAGKKSIHILVFLYQWLISS